VTNLGLVSDDTRLDALNACDCLVLPSEGEAFGIVFLEAWAVGKPVIGPRTPAVASVVSDGQDGWLVPVGDPMAVARALQSWIADPALVRRMGDNGRKKLVERYTCARVADVVEGVYLCAVRARHRAQALGRW
jgi:glycosyltransferase involved in cell wall biosynthesis